MKRLDDEHDGTSDVIVVLVKTYRLSRHSSSEL